MPLKGFGEHNLHNRRCQITSQIHVFGGPLEFVVENSEDPAYNAVTHLLSMYQDVVDAKVVIAGLSTSCSQKFQVSDDSEKVDYTAAAFHPDGLILGTDTSQSVVKIWDVKSQVKTVAFRTIFLKLKRGKSSADIQLKQRPCQLRWKLEK